MNKKRAVLISVALYVMTFVVGVILAIAGRLNFSNPAEIPAYFWIISLVTTVAFTAIASFWYFSSEGSKRNVKEGLTLGIFFVVIGFVLDILFFLPSLFTGSNFEMLLRYYKEPMFYLTLILVIGTTTFIGSRNNPKLEKPIIKKSKKENSKNKLK